MRKTGSKREFEWDEDDEESMCQESGTPGKKRRLRSEQLKALERSFEAESKLDPEQKVQLAVDLGLDPRQVAIWFQNRRARWKTNQLERNFTKLQSAYDDLTIEYDAVKRNNETLTKQIDAQIKEMRAKMVSDDLASVMIGDGPFGLSFNCEPAFYTDVNFVSSDCATSSVLGEELSTCYGAVSSCVMPGNEDTPDQPVCPEIYSFLADEEPGPMFNWYNWTG